MILQISPEKTNVIEVKTYAIMSKTLTSNFSNFRQITDYGHESANKMRVKQERNRKRNGILITNSPNIVPKLSLRVLKYKLYTLTDLVNNHDDKTYEDEAEQPPCEQIPHACSLSL